MEKRVWLIALVVALALLVYIGYNRYPAKRAGGSGDVFTSDNERLDTRESTGSTRAPASKSSEEEKIVYPSATEGQAVQPAAPAEGTSQVTQSMQPAPATAPGSDTISPNPPNGMVFSGSGRYQLFRQGNITWRLDTDTGRTCIIFATDEEWKKPRVYKAGCGLSASK